MKTAKNFSLTGAHLLLRPLADADATETYAGWLNDTEVNRYLETRSVTVDELKGYIQEKNESPDALFLGIFWQENGRHIGNVKLEPINWQAHTAVLGILIGEKEYWGRGVATEATQLVCDHAFDDLGLHELTLGVISEHASAIRVYEKCGFTIDRIEKDAVHHGSLFFDRTVMRKSAPVPQRV